MLPIAFLFNDDLKIKSIHQKMIKKNYDVFNYYQLIVSNMPIKQYEINPVDKKNFTASELYYIFIPFASGNLFYSGFHFE